MPLEGPLDEPLSRLVRHAYFAAVSYIDAQVGKLIDELEKTGQAENPVVVLLADHGYQLGDHGMWSKHTNYETSTRVPLLIYAPRRNSRGGSSSARVELIDLYPTVADLAGLEPPDHVEGESLVPLLDAPAALDDAAFSQYARAGKKGLSVRTERYRYVEWRDAESGKLEVRELYDHENDPQENDNIAEGADLRLLEARLQQIWPNRP